MHPRTASGTTGDSHGSSSHGLKHSRSFLTLADLPDASDGAHNLHPPVGDMDIQSNGPQQVTLVQGNQTTRGGLLAKKEASAVSNPFIDVLQGKVKTQVVSLTAPSAAAEARQGGVYTTATAGAAAAAKAYSPRSERRRLKKRQAAYLSLVVVALALLFRKDEGTSRINKELGSFGQQPIAWSHPTQVATSVVSSVIEAYFDRPAAGGAGSGDGEVSAWVMDRWNATRHEAAPLLTEWGESLSPSDVTSKDHHPRPQMQRPSDTWINLNGFWDFKIEPFTNGASVPTSRGFRREKILVPFAIESALSGVGEGVGEGEQLVYRRVFRVEAGALAGGQRCVLHFGALDWKAWVYFNGELLGVNEGGYAPFEFDVTDYLVPDHRQEHELMVVVWDPTEDGHAPHGKQWRNKGSDRLIAPAGMWYTSVTVSTPLSLSLSLSLSLLTLSVLKGIWQTVYMEFVPPIHVERMEMVPRISDRSLDLRVDIVSTSGLMPYVKVSAHTDEHGVVGQGSGWGEEITMNFQEEHMPRLWTPDTPFLYNLTVSLHHSADGPAIDQVESYFAMREISLGRVGESVQFFLNGAPLFQYGVLDQVSLLPPSSLLTFSLSFFLTLTDSVFLSLSLLLDQGYWPDGLYTAPSDEALRWDILKAKELGFNMIRKHAKVSLLSSTLLPSTPSLTFSLSPSLSGRELQVVPPRRQDRDAW